MYFLCGIVHVFISTLLLFQLVSSKLISLKDGEINYEYDDNDFIGEGLYSFVYKGKRIEGEKMHEIAFKVANDQKYSVEKCELEKDFYGKIGEHESIPKFYHYFPKTNETRATIAIELLGENLGELLEKSKYFSVDTVAKIGLQALDALEHLHRKGIAHNDLHTGNIGLSFNDNSKIIIFDFNMCEDLKGTSGASDFLYLFNSLQAFAGSNSMCFHPNFNCDNTWNATQEQLDEMYRNVKFVETLNSFKSLLKRRVWGYTSTVEALRNLLESELDKHKHEPNCNAFEWQKE